MPTYNLRRFSQPDHLKTITRAHLLQLLSPYTEFFAGRGVALPSTEDTDGLDYEGLVRVFMAPDVDTPTELAEALYMIHEMATPEGMDELLVEAEQRGMTFDGSQDPTPGDIAVQVWLRDRGLLERKHAEPFLTRPRSFEYFQTDMSPIPSFQMPTRETWVALEHDLDDWFEAKKRGRACKVFVYPKEGEVWFLVRHGEPYKREGSFEAGQSSQVFYRPEKHDVLVYDMAIGELRINAGSKGEKQLYREKFGLHLFGNDEFFPNDGKYTLEPLRTDGTASLVCLDVEGIDWVRLKEIRFYWGGAQHETEVRKADDIFAAYEARQRPLPDKARILGASFQVKFTDSRTPRTVTIRPSNIAQYTRDDDSAIVEDWLVKRGFSLVEKHEQHDEDAALLASS